MYPLCYRTRRRRTITSLPIKPFGPFLRTQTRCRNVSPVQASYLTQFCAFFTAQYPRKALPSLQTRLGTKLGNKALMHQAAACILPPTLPSPLSEPLSGISKKSGQISFPHVEQSVARHWNCPPTTSTPSPCFHILSHQRLSFELLPLMLGNRYLHLPMTGAGHQPPSSPSATPANSSSVWGRTPCEQCGRVSPAPL